MTIVSHKHRFIFLKTRKTAGSSIEQWLIPHLGRKDMIATGNESWPLPVSFWATPNPTVSFPKLDMKRKRQMRRLLGWPKAFILSQHMSAEKVRKLVGDGIWDDYLTFCVVRKPWERMISLWQWRRHRFNSMVSFDTFLDFIENDPSQSVARNASNLEVYLIDGKVAVDKVIDYDNLTAGMDEVCAAVGIRATDALPHLKAGFRGSADSTQQLSQRQVDRISEVYAAEISLWGWQPPPWRGGSGL